MSGLGNGNRRIVSVLFDEAVQSATLTLSSYRGGNIATGDGFGIDDVAVNVAPAPVPLPAGFVLLAGGLAALGFLRRRA